MLTWYTNYMKIGIFDSGIGGLIIFRAIAETLPLYDYVYLGDTKRAPYGNLSQEDIYIYTRECVDVLFKEDCVLIIIACNTASSRALQKLQKEYLPNTYPNRRILGVIIPTVEHITIDHQNTIKKIGLLATSSTVESKAFIQEIYKLNRDAMVFQQAAPKLVPLIEDGHLKDIAKVCTEYLKPLIDIKIDTLILGCTHYSLLVKEIREHVGENIILVDEKDIIPKKLAVYLQKHQEIECLLTKHGSRIMLVTKMTKHIQKLATDWFGPNTKLEIKTVPVHNN